MRSGDPAKLTVTPRAVSASATASDGSTWPAVPPAAITHASPVRSIARDVKEDADGGEHDDEARAAVGDERERDPRQRREAHHRREVDRRLAADEHGEARGEALPERVPAAQRDPQARVREREVREHESGRAEEPELL